jgi:hypothetical protein
VLIPPPDFDALPREARRRLAAAGAFWTPPDASDEDFLYQLEKFEGRDENDRSADRQRSYRRASANAEALVGHALMALGLDELRYEEEVAGKTPDWSRTSEPGFLLDVFARIPGRQAVHWLVDDSAALLEEAVADGDLRQLWSSIEGKAVRYRAAAEQSKSPLVLTVVALPLTSTSAELIATPPKGLDIALPDYLFERYPHLGGVMVLEPNEKGELKLTLWSNPDCMFPLPPQLRAV